MPSMVVPTALALVKQFKQAAKAICMPNHLMTILELVMGNLGHMNRH